MFSGVISDITGVGARAILGGLIAGERDPERLADLAKTPIKATKAQLAAALTGRVRKNHVILLRLHLEQITALEGSIATIDQEVEKRSAPFRQLIDILDSIPGIGPLAASILLSEIGTDMSRFPSHAHLISWVGMCPRNDESAGKRRSTRMRKGAPWLKTVLIQCAWAAVKKKGCYFQAQYRRLKARRGAKKAIGAVAASLLTCAYHMISNGTYYEELGADHFEKRQSEGRRIKKLVERFAALGYDVEIKPITA